MTLASLLYGGEAGGVSPMEGSVCEHCPSNLNSLPLTYMNKALLPHKVETKNGKMRYKFPKKEEVLKHENEYQAYIEKAQEQLEKNGLPNSSAYNMMLVLMQVKARFPEHLNDAIPYLTIKTFNQWKAEKRKVKKGEKAMQAVTLVRQSYKDENGERIEDMEAAMFPKTAHVFGIWQTELIK